MAENFKTRLQELENHLSNQEEVIKDANRDRLNLKQHLKRAEEECERLKKYEVQCKESENENISLKLKHFEKDMELKQVKQHLADVRQQLTRLQELENHLSNQEEVIKDANRDRLNLKQHLKRAEEECERLKKYEVQCKESKATSEKMERLAGTLQSELSELIQFSTEQEASATAKQEELKEMLEAANKERIAFEEQMEQEERIQTELQKQLDKQRERWESEVSKADLLTERVHSLEIDVKKECVRSTELQGELEKEREKGASLKEENTRLQEALDRDPQGKLLKLLYDDLQVVRTGVKDISAEVRKVNEQLPDPASRVSELENENISLKLKHFEKDMELKQVKQHLADVRQQLVRTVQNKRKEEDECLIEKALEGMREQQMAVMKGILSHLNVPTLAGVPQLDSGDKDEALDKEKLIGQVEDLQKQLKEKEEKLNIIFSRLTEMIQERDSIERELRDAFSLQEETVKKLQDEVACQKSQSQDLSQKLAQSKECIKALENMLTNLILWERPAEEGVEQISSDICGVDAIETVVPGPIAHETELKKFCWIPFGIQTLTVRQEGGLFPLQPQSKELSEDRGVIMLKVPENAVNTAVCDELCIRYGVIVYGPFDVPEGYQLGTMAVYIYFEEDHSVKPVLLHLPHWSGEDGESSLKCAIAPHRLEEGEEKYKFRLTEDGDFHSTEGSGVIAIVGHCSLFAAAFDKGASLKCFAHSFEKEGVKNSTLDVVITYAHVVWCEILEKRHCTATITCCKRFAFGDRGIIQARLKAEKGNGWESWIHGATQVALSDLEYTSYKINNGKELEAAVTKRRWYPPSILCLTTYCKSLKKSGDPTKAVLVVEGADKPMEFVCTAYKFRTTGQLLQRLSLSPRSSTASVDNEYSDDKKFSSKNFMKKYMDVKSLEVVQAEEIASRLDVTCSLPPRVCSSIRNASTEEDAARKLFKHFQKQGTKDTIILLCDVMMGLKGYHNMNHLGEKMKNDKDLLLPYEDI